MRLMSSTLERVSLEGYQSTQAPSCRHCIGATRAILRSDGVLPSRSHFLAADLRSVCVHGLMCAMCMCACAHVCTCVCVYVHRRTG